MDKTNIEKIKDIKSNKNKKVFIYLAAILIVFCIICMYRWYNLRQKSVKIVDKNIFSIETDDETDLKKIAKKWIDSYTKQYMQKYVKKDFLLKSVDIQNINIIDQENNIVEITFKIDPVKSDYFVNNWYGKLDQNKEITCDWVVMLEAYMNNDDKIIASVKTIETSDEYLNDIKNGVKFVKEKRQKYAYKVKQGKLYVSFDADKEWIPSTWILVPIDINALKMYNSKQTLDDKCYLITPSSTYFITTSSASLYGHNIVYSDDQGKNWHNISIGYQDENVLYTTVIDKNYVFAMLGYDYSLTECAVRFIKSNDLGKTWQQIGNSPREYMSSNTTAVFFDKNLGFVKETLVSGQSAVLYRTDDGLKTFSKVKFENQTLKQKLNYDISWDKVFDSPMLPTLQNGVMTEYISQGSDGDYAGGVMAKYTSTDFGKTWNYIDEFKIEE